MTTQERQAIELSATNAQLRNTLSQVHTHETELEVEVASLKDDLLVAIVRETTFQSLLDKERKVSDERLAQLERIADDSVLSAHAELMQEFKDEKSGEWDPNYCIRLALLDFVP